MSEPQTRAAAAKKPASSSKKPSSTAKKPSSSAKKPSSNAKKPSTAAKKPAASIRLSAAEKKLIQNYRKCNLIEKKLVETLAEKASGDFDLSAITNLLK